MMGFYAAYNGLIYNEVFAIPVEFFGSCYTENVTLSNASDPNSTVAFIKEVDDCVYTIGLDPRWA